jgi:hypothetical protein
MQKRIEWNRHPDPRCESTNSSGKTQVSLTCIPVNYYREYVTIVADCVTITAKCVTITAKCVTTAADCVTITAECVMIAAEYGYGIRSRAKNNIPTRTRDLYRCKIGPNVLVRPVGTNLPSTHILHRPVCGRPQIILVLSGGVHQSTRF